MHLVLKDESIDLNGLSLEMIAALYAAMGVWKARGMCSLVITSALDGTHKPGSKHPAGHALDLRSRTLPDVFGMADQLRAIIGPDYDVVVEPDHIHIEYDPKS